MKVEKSEHTPDMPHNNSGRYGGHGSYKKKKGVEKTSYLQTTMTTLDA
jgi:hypothetical protein